MFHICRSKLRITGHLLLLSVVVLVACSSGSGREGVRFSEPFAGVLTLELTFGAEDMPEDYLLVDPLWFGLAVHPDGRLLVADENWIKVFDPTGQPVMRFGGEGDGPGEFRRARDLYMSPDGYLSVFGGRMGFTAHYFRPDFNYIERVNYMSDQPYSHIFEANGLRTDRPEIVWCLGEDSRLLVVGAMDVDRSRRDHREVFLFYQDADSIHVMAQHEQTDAIYGPQGPIMMTNSLGKLLAAPLPGGRAVYLHSFHDSQQSEEESTYTLNIIDLESLEIDTITHRYLAHELEWTRPQQSVELREKNPEQWREWEERWDIVDQGMAERKWAVPVLLLETDGPFIFAFTPAKNDSNEVLTDVFNADDCSYVGSAWFLPDYYGARIAGGYLYKFNEFRAEEDFPRVEKYRIDPRVYGRR